MKRYISTALSTLLLFTGMICPAVLPAVGLSSSGEMQTAGSWRVYASNTPSVDENGTIADSWAAVTVNTDEKYVNSGVDSLKLSCKSQNAVLLIDVNKNKDYEIVFNYYSETLYNNLNESYIFSRVVVQKPSGKTAWNSEDNLSTISYNISYTGPYSQRIENQNRTTTATVNEWNQFSISFNSGDNDQVALILVPVVDNVYVDDLNLVEKSEAVDSASLNDAANWYDGSSNQVSALPIVEEQSWGSVNNVTGDDVPGGAFESALRCNGNHCIAFGTKLMLEPNTTYTLSFSYYAESSAKISSESQNTACLKGVGAYPFSEELKWSDICGSMTPSNWNLCTNTENKLFNIVCTDSAKVGSNITGLCNKPSGEWNEFSATFNSQNVTEALFYFNKQSTTVDNVYIADLKLVKKSGDLNDPSAWKLYKNNSTHIGENGTPVDDWAKVTENTDTAYIKDGDSSLNFSCISQHGAAEFEVEQNKDYIISFKYYSDSLNAAGTYILSQVAVMTPNGAVGYMSEDNLSYVSSDLSYTGPYSERETNSNSTAVTETGWHDFEIGFNSGSHTKLALRILFAASPVYVDCIELNELSVNDGGVVEITSNKGQSIRTSEPMGLRFKSNIKKSLLESGIEGFKIVEYGSVAIRTAILGEAELTLGSKGNNESGYEIAAKKGTAYKNDGTNLIFAEYDDSYDFTAVLINIGLQSNERTDYGFFAQEYSVRTYAVLERAGVQITVYDDETVNASVFDVMKAILNGGQSDDKEAVTAMLSQNSEMLAAYQEFDPDFIL